MFAGVDQSPRDTAQVTISSCPIFITPVSVLSETGLIA
jgi:hypothetical protein